MAAFVLEAPRDFEFRADGLQPNLQGASRHLLRPELGRESEQLMPGEPMLSGDFHADLKTLLPRLRVYALSLTRDRDRADDLLQQTVVKALAGRGSFCLGTNLAAWLMRIERNEFISNLRRDRPTVCLDEVVLNSLSHPPGQESGLVMREFRKAFGCLPANQREALLLMVLEGWSHEQIAAHCAVTIGTVKSRVWRARRNLHHLLADRDSTGGATSTSRPRFPQPQRTPDPTSWRTPCSAT
jgi:RNA polymerase sigma-70 factor (ECF subfamily)